MQNQFRQRAEDAGAEDFYNDGSRGFRMSEDDGAFFVESGGVRAVWYFGQEVSRREFNRQANQALQRMGYASRYNGL